MPSKKKSTTSRKKKTAGGGTGGVGRRYFLQLLCKHVYGDVAANGKTTRMESAVADRTRWGDALLLKERPP